MALLSVQTVTAAGVTSAAPTQLTAWTGGDTIAGSDVGTRGVVVEVANASGGSLDLRVSDPGRTPAGNTAANGYASHVVATGTTKKVWVGPGNVDPATGAVKIGASTAHASFTVRVERY